MKVLLDTCCILWAVADPERLSKTATVLLQDADADVLISPISAAEIACAVARKRIELDRHWKHWLNHFVELNQWQVEWIGLEIMEEAYSLPEQFHADPADRIITATARLLNAVLLTADRKILNYPHVKAVW